MAESSTVAELSLHPDRLLPPDPAVRAIARWVYDAERDLPMISPHGHVDPRLPLPDEPFPHRRPRAAAHHLRRRWRAEGAQA